MSQSYTMKAVTDKSAWEAFVLAQTAPQFMQSWNAGEQALAQKKEIARFALYAGESIVSVCFGEVVRAKRGSFLLIPYGPIFSELTEPMLLAWRDGLAEWGRKQGLDFLRFCPYLEETPERIALFLKAGFVNAPIHTLAEHIWLLPLEKDESALMAGMSKTTRNLIRRAQKDGVTVTFSTDDKDVEHFLELHRFTKERHQFTPYPDSLFRAQVQAFRKDGEVAVLCAYHEQKLIASAIIMYYGTMASYHHGASIPSKIPAAYLLQWKAIEEAKRRGCTHYNFWGVTDLTDNRHPFYGISLFKTRFGGHPMTLLYSQDYPLTGKYRFTRIIETIRRVRRGFGLKRAH